MTILEKAYLYKVTLHTHAGQVGAKITVCAANMNHAARIGKLFCADHPNLDPEQISPQFSVKKTKNAGDDPIIVEWPV